MRRKPTMTPYPRLWGLFVVRPHMRTLAIITSVLLLTGCASDGSSFIPPRTMEENGQLMSEPTPSEWKAGSVWNFVQHNQDGEVVLDVTFRITDVPAETCSSGDWRVLELVNGKIGDGSIPLKHAYSVSGRLLTLDLTGWCDVGEIQGALTNGSFTGQTTGGAFTGGKFIPERVVGHRLN